MTLLKELHWLRVPVRMTFWLAVLAYRCQHNMAPHYVTAQLQHASNVGYRQHLRSSSLAMLDAPRTEHGHRWPCIQFNCSSCVEQFANGSAVFWVTGHFSTPPENWTVRAFLQLTLRLSNDFTAAWLTFTFPQLFAVAATLKSINIMLLWHSFLIIITIIVVIIFVLRVVCSGLPSKSPDDIIRHQLMYDQMVEAARKKGWCISHAQSAFTYTSVLLLSKITLTLCCQVNTELQI